MWWLTVCSSIQRVLSQPRAKLLSFFWPGEWSSVTVLYEVSPLTGEGAFDYLLMRLCLLLFLSIFLKNWNKNVLVFLFFVLSFSSFYTKVKQWKISWTPRYVWVHCGTYCLIGLRQTTEEKMRVSQKHVFLPVKLHSMFFILLVASISTSKLLGTTISTDNLAWMMPALRASWQ